MKLHHHWIGVAGSNGYCLRRAANCMALALASVLVIACGGGGAGPQVQAGDTQGTILEMIAKSTAPDSDGDGLPDDVEAYLGTDPHDRDSDHDGIPDLIEVFGPGTATPSAVLADRNGNGKIAAVDPDDDGDGIIDGQQIDSDGDGIPDYLEYYGFTYNPLTGKYAAWDGDYSKTYYKTDPHQRSTDQDPFDDALEVTGVNMDPSVTGPGNLPMVPAYPDIMVRLEGYSVTLNQVLTWTEGASLSKGTTWDRTTEASHSDTSESSWEVGAEVSVKLGKEAGAEIKGHVNYGWGSSSTSSTSTSVSTGGSILSEQNWSSSRTENPVDAARIKLFLKVHNKGTAVASNLRPAFTLKIGGRNVATIVPSAQVNLLEPGGVYPAPVGVYWVVDSTQSGAPLSLTLSELQALESGASVSITLTQMAADVMRLNPSTGAYESAGDWNEYMARVRAVSASLFFDRGDGNTVSALVYAHNSTTSPVVTLGDALVWATKARQDPVTREVFVSYYDEVTRRMREASLKGWRIAVDGETFEANGFSLAKPMPDGFDIASLRLSPKSRVIAKAPRAQVPKATPAPSILSAQFDPAKGTVSAVTSDYNGIRSVVFVDRNGNVHEMKPDLPESSFYVYAPALDTESFPEGYQFAGTERVRATNVDGQEMMMTVTARYTDPVPKAPEFIVVKVDFAEHRIYANIKSDLPLKADNPDSAFLRIYGGGFNVENDFSEGYCEMVRVANWFEDPMGWVCPIPKKWDKFETIKGARIVAYAGPDLKKIWDIVEGDILPPHMSGHGVLNAAFHPTRGTWVDWLWADPAGELVEFLNIESGAVTYYLGPYRHPITLFWPLVPYAYIAHAVSEVGPLPTFVISLRSRYLGVQGDSVDYNSLVRAELQTMMADAQSMTYQVITCPQYPIDYVFIYQTAGGLYGKMKVTCNGWYGRPTYRNDPYGYGLVANVTYEFVTFNEPPPPPPPTN